MISNHPTEEAILARLRTLDDPELGVNVVDLGLVDSITITPEADVIVDFLLTSPGCPMRAYLEAGIYELVSGVPGVNAVNVRIRDDMPWTPDRILDPRLLR